MVGDVRFRTMAGRLNRNLAAGGGKIQHNKPHLARCSAKPANPAHIIHHSEGFLICVSTGC